MAADPKEVAKLLEILDDEVTGCYACAPWDVGEPFWLGPHAELAEIIGDAGNFDDAVIEETVAKFSCPECGCDLTLYDEVMYKSEHERRVEETIKAACDPSIIDRLEKFSEFLAAYPYLGAIDPAKTAQDIIGAITETEHSTLSSSTWYRARLLNVESRVYKSVEMGAPDPRSTYVKEGRYNHTGQSFLYLSDSEETALAEVSSGVEDVCVIQEYKGDGVDKILDLTVLGDDFAPNMNILWAAIIYNGYARKAPDRKSSWKPEYFVPRFLADVARLQGFSGIKFTSAIVRSGTNLVLFNPNHPKCTPVDEPLLFHKKPDDMLAIIPLAEVTGGEG